MRKFKVLLIGILVLTFLNTCKQFLKDPEEDFSYWTSTVYVKNTDISRLPLDKDNYSSIPQGGDYKIKLNIFNKKNHSIRAAVDSNSNKDIVVFEKGVTGADGTNPPKAGVDYTLKQINQNTLELNLSNAFLEKSEYGIQNLSPIITLYNKEGHKFPKTYTFKLRANTPPPSIEYKAIGKTRTADANGKYYYVLCFAVKDMDKTIGTELLHKDIAGLSVMEKNGSKNTIPLTVDAAGFNINSSNALLLPNSDVQSLSIADMTTAGTPDAIPTGNWHLYFKTDVEVKGASKTYTFKLVDQKGLNSPELKTNTATNKLLPVKLYYNNTPITGTTETNPHLINSGSNAAVTLQAHTQAGAAITGTIERKTGSSWTAAGTVSGTTTAALTLPALASVENEAVYKISLQTNAAGYTDSEEKTFFVKLTKELVVTFSVDGGHGGSLKGVYNGSEKTASGSTSQTFTVALNGTVTFTAQPATGYEVEKWTDGSSTVNGTNIHYTLTGITEAKTVQVKFKRIEITIAAGSDAWKALKEAIRQAEDGDTIIIDGEIKATTAPDNNGEIVINKSLTIQGKTGKTTDILNADKGSFGAAPFRIFKVKKGKKLTLKNLTLKNGKNDETDTGGPPNPNGKGGAVYSKGELEIRNVIITECEAKHAGGGIYCKMSGSGESDERKFLMTNTDVTDCKVSYPSHGTGGGVYISGDDCLMNVKMTAVTIKNNQADKWGAGLYLGVSQGAKTTANSVVLTSVTLEENELTNSSYAENDGGGGMAFSSYNTTDAITLKNCTITKNKTKSNGGGIKLTRSSGTLAGNLILENCTVTENEAAKGGGVYIKGSNLEMQNGVLTGNTATSEGGGIYLKDGTFKMSGSATVTPALEANKNDIYLAGGKKISLESTLNPAGGIAGRITPETYAVTTQVLEQGSGVTLANEVSKFTVTPKDLGGGNSEQWGITDEGKLKLTSAVIDGSGSNAWKKLKEAVEAIADDGTITINGEIKATSASGNSGEIVIDKKLTIKKADGASSAVLNANKLEGGKPAHRIFNVKANAHFTLDGLTLIGGQTPSGDPDPHGGAIFMSGAGINASITACIIGDADPSSTVKNTAVQKGGGIYLNISGGSLTVKNTNILSCTASGSDDSTGGGGGIYLESGTLIFEGVQMKGNTAANGKGRAVWVEGGSFKIKDSSESLTYLDVTTVGGKNPDDVYLAADNKITVNGTLALPKVARITPQNYTAGTQVVEAENGVTLSEVTNKFTVTPQTLSGNTVEWAIDNTGKLKKANITVNSSDSNAWLKFKNAVEDTNGPTEITINGTITAPNGATKIDVKRTVTIKGTNKNSDILDADEKCFIFHVWYNGDLTLQNLTLKKGKNSSSANPDGGGAIYCADGKLTTNNVVIRECEADKGGGIYAKASSSNPDPITLINTEIIECKATVGDGGGIYLHGYTSGNLKLTMKKEGSGISKIENCKAYSKKQNGAKAYGGAVYIKGKSTFILHESKINDCSAIGREQGGRSGVGNGGGVYVDNDSTFNMQEGAIISNCSSTEPMSMGNNGLSDGGAVYVTYRGKFYMSGSATVTPSTDANLNVKGKNDIYLAPASPTGAKITINETLNPQGGTAGRITPRNYPTGGNDVQVLDGDITTGTPQNYTKFTVTPQDLGGGNKQHWTIDTDGKLKKDFVEVSFTNLGSYLQNTASATEVNHIKVIGLTKENLKGTSVGGSPRPSPLGQVLKDNYTKKVSLILPETVEDLEDMSNCFNGCTSLIRVSGIPASVTNMNACFKSCSGLTQAPVLPENLTSMTSCFLDCTSLTQAPDIPASVTNMSYCFKGCSGLTQAPVIHGNVTSMENCFSGCTSLVQAPVIPASVTNMSYCFYNCTALTEAPDIPSIVTDMQKCFQNCTSMKGVKLNCDYNPSTIVGEPAFKDAFQNCNALEEGGIKVPSGQFSTYQTNATTMGTTAAKFGSW